MLTRLRLLAVLVVLGAFLVVPATSEATLVFTRNPVNPAVFVANDDGSAVRRIGQGSNPRVSPDGETIVFYRSGKGKQPAALMVVAASGGAPKKLATGWQAPFVFAWSSDSSRIAFVTGPETGQQQLNVIDLTTRDRFVASGGYFGGVSFSPESNTQLVYSMAASESFPPRSDIYRADILPLGVLTVSASQPHRLTSDSRSFSPIWGPNDQIVFVKHLGEGRRKYGPKNDLFLMSSSGGQVKRLTHTEVGPLLTGLSPTEWSANGSRLLAEFGGQDTSYAVTVNPRTGAERALTREREVGFVGTALSSDGSTVLGSLGGFEPGPGHKVVSIPYAGGRPKLLARNASEPDWSR